MCQEKSIIYPRTKVGHQESDIGIVSISKLDVVSIVMQASEVVNDTRLKVLQLFQKCSSFFC